MQSKRSLLSFFPTYAWVFQLEPPEYEPLNRALMSVLTPMMERLLPESGGRSRQTDTNLHELPEFEGLNRILLEAGKEIVEFLNLKDNPMFVSGCWANFGQPNTSHHEHSHPNNFLSAVYYLRTPKGGNSISFSDPRSQAHILAPPVKQPHSNNASHVTVEVAEGRLIVFPAWLRHYVDVNNSKETRISVAINLMFQDYGSDLSKPRFSGNLTETRVKPG